MLYISHNVTGLEEQHLILYSKFFEIKKNFAPVDCSDYNVLGNGSELRPARCFHRASPLTLYHA